jgi:hypothetical protein
VALQARTLTALINDLDAMSKNGRGQEEVTFEYVLTVMAWDQRPEWIRAACGRLPDVRCSWQSTGRFRKDYTFWIVGKARQVRVLAESMRASRFPDS